MKIADKPFYYGLSSGDETKLENTAEAIATFIVTAGKDCDLEILSPDGDDILNTFGMWINRCPDKEFLAELKAVLIPKQKELMESLGFPPCPC